jgi:hypothetical protein
MKMPPPLFLLEVIIGSNSVEMQSKGMKMRMNTSEYRMRSRMKMRMNTWECRMRMTSGIRE